MDQDELVDRVLSLPEPWLVEEANLDEPAKEVEVRVKYGARRAPCPECGKQCAKHDSIERRWRHLDMWDYRTWIFHNVSNAASESVNSRVQALKKRANGYRSRVRFRDAIMFHLGGLDLYPSWASSLESQ